MAGVKVLDLSGKISRDVKERDETSFDSKRPFVVFKAELSFPPSVLKESGGARISPASTDCDVRLDDVISMTSGGGSDLECWKLGGPGLGLSESTN